MRNHDEFMAEVYSRKNEYIKGKKQRKKTVLTFAIPFAVLILGYSVMILPAMMPAGKADYMQKEHEMEPFGNTTVTQPNTEAATEAKTEALKETDKVLSTTQLPSVARPEATQATTVNENTTAKESFAKIAVDGETKFIEDESKIKQLQAALDIAASVPEFATERVTEAASIPSSVDQAEIRIEISAGDSVLEFELCGSVLKNLSTGEECRLSSAQLKQVRELIEF